MIFEKKKKNPRNHTNKHESGDFFVLFRVDSWISLSYFFVVRLLFVCTGLFIAALGAGCGPNSSILNSKPDAQAPINNERPVTSFEKDIEDMRTANFEYIFALRRKDGGKLDAEDKKFIRENKPLEINRAVLSDDDKALIAGSHFPFPPANLKALQARFDFRDFSDHPATQAGNANVNVNVNR
jgi:hypothetical protein